MEKLINNVPMQIFGKTYYATIREHNYRDRICTIYAKMFIFKVEVFEEIFLGKFNSLEEILNTTAMLFAEKLERQQRETIHKVEIKKPFIKPQLKLVKKS